jgi:hydrogenase maturation protease
MIRRSRGVVIGIGSHHGDDALGWQVVDRLAALPIPGIEFAKLRQPIEMLEFLEDYHSVHLVDAACGLSPQPGCQPLKYASPQDRRMISEVRTHGTHDMTVSAVLTLAQTLGKRTDHVTLWLGSAVCFVPCGELSPTALASIDCCCDAITANLSPQI